MSIRVLRVLLGFTIAESFVHYLDNTVRYDDYSVDDPSLLGKLVVQWVIPVAWILFTVTAVIGYRRFRQGQWSLAAMWLAVYSLSGLISIGHYLDISVSDLSPFQNMFVFLDIAAGALVLAFAIWTARRGAAEREEVVLDLKST